MGEPTLFISPPSLPPPSPSLSLWQLVALNELRADGVVADVLGKLRQAAIQNGVASRQPRLRAAGRVECPQADGRHQRSKRWRRGRRSRRRGRGVVIGVLFKDGKNKVSQVRACSHHECEEGGGWRGDPV